jgi:1-acyl-sn-glycerol-3-phosphate acyltransferase
MEKAADYLRRGVSVLFFAEGTRKIDGATGPLGPFKAGAFSTAIAARVPILPIAISGARFLMPASGFPVLN